MVLLFVVCGWRKEAVAGVFLRTTWYILHTFFWLPGLRKSEKLYTQLYKKYSILFNLSALLAPQIES
jgi:hypothetical protein